MIVAEKVNPREKGKDAFEGTFSQIATRRIVETATRAEAERRADGGRSPNDEFHPCAIVQFYSAEFVCAADCLGSNDDGSNESELKRSIKNVNSPNWDVKWYITVSVSGRDPTNRSRLSLIAREVNPTSRHFYGVESRKLVTEKKGGRESERERDRPTKVGNERGVRA